MPDGILARVPHEIARYGARVSQKKRRGGGGDSRETKVLVKASRAYSPIFEYQPHLLLLTVFLVGQACLQYRNLYVLLCMIWLVEVGR